MPAARKKTVLDEPASVREKVKEIGALFFVLCATFVFISLITFDPADIGSVHYPANDPPENKGGRWGADLAYALLAHLGLASFVLVLLVAFWAFLVFFRRRVKGLYLKLVAAGVTVLAAATLFSLQGIVTAGAFSLEGTAPGAGGIYGEALRWVAVEYFGTAGAYLCVLLALGVSMVLATDWMVYTGTIRLGRWVRAVSGRIRNHFSDEERRKRFEARQAKARGELAQAVQRQRLVPQAPPPAPVAPPRPAQPAPNPPSLPAMRVAHKPAQGLPPYEQPPLRLFEDRVERIHGTDENDVKRRTLLIEQTLKEFGIDVRVVNYEIGPAVTIYELQLAPGTPIPRVVARQDEISMKLAVPPVRVVGPIPGKDTVGVEVPNPFPDTVRLRQFVEKDYSGLRKVPLPVLLGKTNAGESIVRSLTEMPHMLIAGTTGSGKSVCLKSIVTSLVCGMSWDELKLILIDPKMVELSAFKDIPHLWAPVVTDAKKAAAVLEWLVREMEDRYIVLNKVGSRNIEAFNKLGKKKLYERLIDGGVPEDDCERFPNYLPYVVVIIDELADLMMTARKEVEHSIIRISQKARAVGIHVVAATQRPSTDVVTGLIRSNLPSRIAFRVASSIESRIILGYRGAERLLGMGDMLVLLAGSFQPVRAQCTFVSDDELRGLVKFLRAKGKPVYHDELVEIEAVADLEGTAEDDLFEDAVRVIVTEQRGSVSLLQRKLSIG
ncbi:MAG: DNA translocase FtsK, partial [Planctomycetota bacterium]